MHLKRLLYVEDDADIRKIVEMVFELSGLNAKICDNALSALEAVKEESFDLALIDVMMPEMDGVMLFQKLRRQGYQFPVLFMTAKSQQNEIEQYLSMGVIGVIRKPFDPEKLLPEIDRLYREKCKGSS